MSTDSSRVPKPIEQLVEVFETHLGEVTFPGVTDQFYELTYL